MRIPIGYAQVNMEFAGAALPRGAQVVYGVQLVQPAVLDTPFKIAEFVNNEWQTVLKTQFTNQITLNRVLVKFGPNATGIDGFQSEPATGGAAADADSPQVALLVTKSTAFGGRTGRGRMFFPGWPEASTSSGGKITATQRGLVQTNFTTFLNNHSNASLPMVLLHDDPALNPFTITALTVNELLATQRRRIRKVGGRRRIV